MSPHVITATVNGETRRWERDDIDAALQLRNALIKDGVVPGSGEPASNVVLLIAGQKAVVIPAGGWQGPRAKSETAD